MGIPLKDFDQIRPYLNLPDDVEVELKFPGFGPRVKGFRTVPIIHVIAHGNPMREAYFNCRECHWTSEATFHPFALGELVKQAASMRCPSCGKTTTKTPIYDYEED